MSGEDIKPGYKRTEVGVIPEEWRVETIGSIFQLKQGVQTPVELQSAIEKEGYKRFIRIVDVTDPSITWRYIKDPGIDHHISPNDLFMVRYGSPGLLGIGFSGIIANNLFRLIPKKAISVHFYYQYIKNKKAEIVDISGSSTMPAINFGTLSALAILYPPLAEQRAIATALSDVNALLAKLDQLIAKKRDLKQATMQQLLTGQTRLPGFSGEWEVKRLGDVAVLKNGYTFKSESYTELGKYKVVTIANVQDGWMRLDGGNSINSLPIDLQPHQKLEIGDLLLSMTGNVGRVCQVAEGNCLLNQRVGKIVAQNINFDFLHAIISGVAFQKSMTDVAKGGAQPNLSASDILNYPVNMPVDENEQKAIAAVIFDIKSELTTLQARRDKTRALKQGMMQELLTGRIRLI